MRAQLWATVKTTVASIILALLIGAVLIALSNPDAVESLRWFFAYPWDFFRIAGEAVGTSYAALVKGSVGSFDNIATTLNRSAPLICAGLGVTLAFRAGLFNIGAQGQMILGVLAAGYIGFTWNLPPVIHLIVSVVAGVSAGAAWGAIAGYLKAKVGAHEVITTIMLNRVALVGIMAYALNQRAFQRPDDKLGLPQSPPVDDSASFFSLGGVHVGVAVALLAGLFTWWILERSTFGFELRAFGSNPHASETAGMSAAKIYTLVMVTSGGLSGLAATMLVNGDQYAITEGLVGNIGFDAITVALLGRGTPLGTVLAGLLFGALSVGGTAMQTSDAATPPELSLVIQSLIVLFVAAPALVRWFTRVRESQTSSTFAAKGISA